MPQPKPSTDARADRKSNAATDLRRYCPAAGMLNLALLLEVVNRFRRTGFAAGSGWLHSASGRGRGHEPPPTPTCLLARRRT